MNEKKLPLSIETYRTYLLSRIKEAQIGRISHNPDGNPTFDVTPLVEDYFWVLDLAERTEIKATPHSTHTTITITGTKQ